MSGWIRSSASTSALAALASYVIPWGTVRVIAWIVHGFRQGEQAPAGPRPPQATMEPKRYAEFTTGEVLPADSRVAQWVSVLGAISNNLVLSYNRALELAQQKGTEVRPERIYFSRLAISHLREAIKFLWDADKVPEVREFVSRLPQGLRDKYSKLERLFADLDGTYLRHAKNIRDYFFHYPLLSSAAIQAALEEVACERAAIVGDPSGNVWFEFGDNTNLAASTPGLSFEQKLALFHEAADDIERVVDFAQGAIKTYLDQRPGGAIQWAGRRRP